jgi:hypothetical protein
VIPVGDRALHLTSGDSEKGGAPDATEARAPAIAKHLADEDLRELRDAIERSLCEGEMYDSSDKRIDDELRKSLRVACAKARLQRVRAEHVVIDLKQIWTLIPTMLTTRTETRLSEIITACIAEYYDKDAPAQV